MNFWSRQPVFTLATLTGKRFCADRPVQCLEKETEHISFANQTLESTAVWDCLFQFNALFFIAHNRKQEKVLFFKAVLFVGLFPEKASDFCNAALQMMNMMYFTPDLMLLHQIYTRLRSHAGHGSLPVRELNHSSEAAESFHSLVICVVFIWQRDLKVLCRGPSKWAHVCPPAKEDLTILSSTKPTSFSSEYFWTQSSISLSAMVYTSLKVFTSVVFPCMHGRADSFFTLSLSYPLVSILAMSAALDTLSHQSWMTNSEPCAMLSLSHHFPAFLKWVGADNSVENSDFSQCLTHWVPGESRHYYSEL